MITPNYVAKVTPQDIVKNVIKNAELAHKSQHEHTQPHTSVREADYNGHHIVVRTTYQIEVDGKPITGHIGATNDGRVHYHPIPNLSFTSAIALVKKLIDAFPDDFKQ